MLLRNLFTSSSRDSVRQSTPKSKTRQRVETIAKTSLGFVSTLAVLDVAINLLFPYPSDPLNISPGAMNLYFDYGRSIEGKVTRQLGNSDETSAPLARAGWIETSVNAAKADKPDPGDQMLVAIYGMSFAEQVGTAMEKIDPKLTIRMVGGPSAPPNHSFATYQADRGHHQAKVVILGILASSVKGMGAMTGMTWGAEVPAPYTFPKYEIAAGKLTATQPEIRTLEELRLAQQNPEKWHAFEQQLQANDQFFDPFTFEKNWLDASASVRLIRRAWAKAHQDQVTSQIHTAEGFNPNWEQVPVLKRIVAEFAATAQQDGKIPVVLLFNDRGYDDHLYQLLKSTLEQNHISFVSTHDIAPATDQTNFVADGHFTEAVNERIAEKVLSLLDPQLHATEP